MKFWSIKKTWYVPVDTPVSPLWSSCGTCLLQQRDGPHFASHDTEPFQYNLCDEYSGLPWNTRTVNSIMERRQTRTAMRNLAESKFVTRSYVLLIMFYAMWTAENVLAVMGMFCRFEHRHRCLNYLSTRIFFSPSRDDANTSASCFQTFCSKILDFAYPVPASYFIVPHQYCRDWNFDSHFELGMRAKTTHMQ